MVAPLRFVPDHNVCAFLDVQSPKSEGYRDIIEFLRRSRLYHTLSVRPEVYENHIRDFWRTATIQNADGQQFISATVVNSEIQVTEDSIRRVLQLGNDEAGAPIEFPSELVQHVFYHMRYQGNCKGNQVKKGMLSSKWRFLIHIFLKSVSNRKAGWDTISMRMASAIVGIVTGRPYSMAGFILNGMIYNLGEGLNNKFLMYPRFLQCLINDALPNIPREGNKLIQSHQKDQIFNKIKKASYVGEELQLFPHMIDPDLPVDPELFNVPIVPVGGQTEEIPDDDDVELLDPKQEQRELVETVSPMSDSLEKLSSPQSDIICVQGYKVKQSNATILETIFKKHGDIAANCRFKTDSVRSSFLEVVCEVVKRIQTDDLIENMEEIECQVSDAEAANINVSWIRAYFEAIHKRKETSKNYSLLMETKSNTILVKRAAQMDLQERSVELVAAQRRFKKAERCVQVLRLVEKNLNDSILECKGKIDSWVKQPVL